MSPRRSAADAQRTRETILEHAAERASVVGLDGLTIGSLAGDLGLSKAGVVGPFGSREELQLAAFRRGLGVFRRAVWDPVADVPSGLARLRAVAEAWLSYLINCPLPGGCLMTTAAVEWDARAGLLHDEARRMQERWLASLSAEAEVAIRAGELPAGTDPEQVAFELNAIAMGLNLAVQLLGDRSAVHRARVAVDRVLASSSA